MAYLGILFYFIITGLAFLSIVFYGSRASRSLSWILIIILFPIVGVILYLFLGLNRRKLKIFSLKQTIQRRLYNETYHKKIDRELKAIFTNEKYLKLATLLSNNNNFLPHEGNKIKVLNNGEITFKTIFNALEKAENFIHLQYYIFEEGKLLDQLMQLFKSKIDQGVEIRILYDAIGSFSWKSTSIKKLKDLGVKIYPIMPFKFGSLLFAIHHRNHRKIIIIDGQIGFTGGFNFSDKYIKAESNLGVWDDMHLAIKGPVVDSLHRIFIKDYYFASEKELLLNEKYLPDIAKAGNKTLQIVSSGPDSTYASIMQQYLKLINLADAYICIANPYFIPSQAVLEALRIAALSDIKVKIMVPKDSDSFLAKYSMFSNFEALLQVGVEIYLKEDNFLHSKVILIDDEIASVGSGNFDSRSFEHNYETNAVIYDKQITKSIFNDFMKDCDSCNKLNYKEFQQRPWYNKLYEGLTRFFSPLL